MSAIELAGLSIERVAVIAATPRLLVINRDPGPGETGVPIDSTIALEWVDTGSDGVDRASARVWINGALAFDGSVASGIAPAFAGAAAGVVRTPDTLRVVLDPVVHLASLTTITVRASAQTVGGAATDDETWSFVVEDRTAPRVVVAQALAPRTVRVAFDKSVALPTSASFAITPQGAPAVPVIVLSATAQDTLVVLTLDTEMTPDVVHQIVASGVTDLFANVVLAPYDRAVFAGFRPARTSARNFDLWRMLPKHNRRDDQTGDLLRFISCLQEIVDLLLADIDSWPNIFDLELAPEAFVDLILADLGNPFAFGMDLISKRRLASVLVEMYGQKGTSVGIVNAVRLLLGIDILAITAFASDTMSLGESELGVDWILGPSDRFAKYAFDVQVGQVLTATQTSQLRAVVNYLKPAHTHFVDLIEPTPPVVPDNWELGLSDLGDTTLLH